MTAAFCFILLTSFMLSSAALDYESDDFSVNQHLPLSAQVVSIPRTFVSPCPRSFRFTFDGEEWYGRVIVRKPAPKGIDSILKLRLSLPYKLSSRYVGEIVLAKDQQTAVTDIVNGRPLVYRVFFPDQSSIPRIFEIYYNDRLICRGPKDVGRFVTTITLEHTLKTPNSSSQAVKPVSHPTPKTISLPVKRANTFELECGSPDFETPRVSGLVFSGRVVGRGQFPWLAAYYHNGERESGFICGGSLVSTKLIVTAAHCIQNKKDFYRRKAEEASFYIGKLNLESLSGEQSYVVSGVTQFLIHPDWNFNDDRYDADIALAVLARTISFTKYVKPICLWTSSTSYEDLVGLKGTVAGWGRTEFKAVSTDRPNWVELEVVSEATCLRSNRVMIELTSERTFCAGNREDRSGPCSGDSGGGFIVQSDSKWFLRGIVSSSLYDSILNTCDTKNYAVFTDVSQFTNWIHGYIHTFG